MIKQTLALVGLILSISGNAAIESLDSSFGTDTITRDTDTGLDWLDVTVTRGLSYNQVTAQMGAGGIYEGWRYATMAELDTLISNFGYTAVKQNCPYTSLHCDSNNNVGGQGELIESIIRTLGDTQDAYWDSVSAPDDISPLGAGYTAGILGSQQGQTGFYDLALILDMQRTIDRTNTAEGLDSPDEVNTYNSSRSGTYSKLSTGSFLVATTAVPIPAAGWLFLTALLVLAGKKLPSHR